MLAWLPMYPAPPVTIMFFGRLTVCCELAQIVEDSTGSLIDSALVRNIETFVTRAPCRHPGNGRMPDPALDVGDAPAGVALIPGAIELLGR